jgi:HEAT repeat protein
VLAEASRLDLSAIDRSLDDARWYVVRNLAVTLRSIGGQPVVSLLDRIANHPERRVRLEVLAALAEVPAESARPILLRMLDTPDVRELSGALRLLAAGRDPEVAQLLLQRLVAPDFVERTPEEHRAVLSALAVTGADQAVTPLALQLSPLQKPAAHSELLLKSIAQALSRIGTPEARAALELARSSRWSAVKDAATLALSMMRPR